MIAAMEARVLGFIDTPAQGNKRPDGVRWCADNGCYSDNWDEAKWWKFLVANAHAADSCLFAVAPDVVGDAWRSHLRSFPWLQKIRDLGYPVAYVAQDGLERHPIPWHDFDCLFIGGTTDWKLGPHARAIAAEAKRRGKWLHVGRVNSKQRFDYCAAPQEFGGLGADSCDGTFLTFGPEINLPKLLGWLQSNFQDDLFQGVMP